MTVLDIIKCPAIEEILRSFQEREPPTHVFTVRQGGKRTRTREMGLSIWTISRRQSEDNEVRVVHFVASTKKSPFIKGELHYSSTGFTGQMELP